MLCFIDREDNSMVITRSGAGDIMAITNEQLQKDIKEMSLNIGRRLDAIETGLADKIKAAVAELIADVKAELEANLLALERRVAAIETRPVGAMQEDRSLSCVFYGIAESDGEDVEQKVNDLVSTQLALENVQITEAERKPKFAGNVNGVIVAKCETADGKRKIMEAKSKLNNLEHFRHIHIYHDKPKWQRQQEANFRILVKSLVPNRLFLKGNRICEKDQQGNAGELAYRNGQDRDRGADRGAGRGAHLGHVRGAGRGTGRGNGGGGTGRRGHA